jgi:hypothetical protein
MRTVGALGFGLLMVVAAAACSGSGSPVAPSVGNGAGVGSMIRGTANLGPQGAAAAGAVSSGSLATDAPGTVQVCVNGTDVCGDVEGAGSFELSGDFSGDVGLRFTSSDEDVTLMVPDVVLGETVIVTVELAGANSTIHIDSRLAPSSSADDPAEDEVSDDSPDDPSKDNSPDDPSKDNSPDDPSKDDSPDDPSKDSSPDDPSEDNGPDGPSQDDDPGDN